MTMLTWEETCDRLKAHALSVGRICAIAVVACLMAHGVSALLACPFCSAVQMTLTEEINRSDVAVVARLVSRPELPAAPADPNSITRQEPAKATFEVVKSIKGEPALAEAQEIQVLYYGSHELGSQFLILGADPSNIAWSAPIALSERAVKYVTKLPGLAASGPDRMVFFLDYLQDADPLLAGDTYDEFARAPYSDLKALHDQLPREKLVAWIQDPDVAATRRRLYLTMLGVCGQPEDVASLEGMLRAGDRQTRSALDAMIASYITLKGAEGLGLVDELFFKNQAAEYTDTYSAIMAVRWLAQESSVPRERLMESLRYMLERPQLADLVIPDLARWQDWSVMERLVQLFKEADDESAWVRVPVVNYLRACPLPEAKTHLEELAKIDPKTVDRATKFFALSPAPAPPAEGDPKTEAPPKAVVPDAAAASDAPSAVVEARAPADSGAESANDSEDSVDSEDANVAPSNIDVAESNGDQIAVDDDLSSEPRATGEKRNASVTQATGPGRTPTTSTLASDSAAGADSKPGVAAEKDQADVPTAANQEAAGQKSAGQVAAGQGATGSPSPATTAQTPVVGGVWILLGSAAVGAAVFVLLLTILRGGRGRVTT